MTVGERLVSLSEELSFLAADLNFGSKPWKFLTEAAESVQTAAGLVLVQEARDRLMP